LAAAGCAHRLAEDPLNQIALLQDAIDRAMLANDPGALAVHLAGEVSRTGPGGVTTDRQQWLAQVKSGQIRYLSVRRCETMMRAYGSSVIVTGLVDIEVEKPVTGRELEHNRYLRVYIQDKGSWRLAAHQATKAPTGVRCTPPV
jgi:hypothetical protein